MDPVPVLEHQAYLLGYKLDTVESIPAEDATVSDHGDTVLL